MLKRSTVSTAAITLVAALFGGCVNPPIDWGSTPAFIGARSNDLAQLELRRRPGHG
jgi:hypothetical protein